MFHWYSYLNLKRKICSFQFQTKNKVMESIKHTNKEDFQSLYSLLNKPPIQVIMCSFLFSFSCFIYFSFCAWNRQNDKMSFLSANKMHNELYTSLQIIPLFAVFLFKSKKNAFLKQREESLKCKFDRFNKNNKKEHQLIKMKTSYLM